MAYGKGWLCDSFRGLLVCFKLNEMTERGWA